MRKKVTISLHSSTFQGGQSDEWTAIESGWLTTLENGISLSFILHHLEESSMLLIATPTFLSMTRTVKESTSVFFFSNGDTHPVQYKTHFGSFPMDALTQKYVYLEDGFVIEYDILVQGEPSGSFKLSLFIRPEEMNA